MICKKSSNCPSAKWPFGYLTVNQLVFRSIDHSAKGTFDQSFFCPIPPYDLLISLLGRFGANSVNLRMSFLKFNFVYFNREMKRTFISTFFLTLTRAGSNWMFLLTFRQTSAQRHRVAGQQDPGDGEGDDCDPRKRRPPAEDRSPAINLLQVNPVSKRFRFLGLFSNSADRKHGFRKTRTFFVSSFHALAP